MHDVHHIPVAMLQTVGYSTFEADLVLEIGSDGPYCFDVHMKLLMSLGCSFVTGNLDGRSFQAKIHSYVILSQVLGRHVIQSTSKT